MLINLGHTRIELRQDNIVQINAANQIYTQEDIKSIHGAVKKINNSQKALLLLLANEFTSVDTDARKYLSTTEAGEASIAEAYVIQSLAQRLLLNFMIKVNGTPVPVKFFTEIAAAENWLKNFEASSDARFENKMDKDVALLSNP